MTAHGSAVFGEAVALRRRCPRRRAGRDRLRSRVRRDDRGHVVMDSWTIKAGCVAGIAISWQGRRRGRTIVELNITWKKGHTLEPDWTIEEGHVITVEGRPTVRARLEYLLLPDFEGTTFGDFMALMMITTAMPAILPRDPVRRRRATGIVTYNDLPLPLPCGLVARRRRSQQPPRPSALPRLGAGRRHDPYTCVHDEGGASVRRLSPWPADEASCPTPAGAHVRQRRRRSSP